MIVMFILSIKPKMLNVGREVLFFKVGISLCLSCTKQKLAGLKTGRPNQL